MNRDAIFQHIDENQKEHVENIQRWVRQKSVSWDNLGVRECAEVVAQSYQNLGCQEVEIIEGRYHPGVWAFYDAGAPVTVHNYCMFDTRTVRPQEWPGDPWSGELDARGPYPKVLIGRGAMGAKGPYVAFLNALESIIAVEGTLPVNIMFLAEGEEIMGSPSYPDFVARYRDRLETVAASYCLSSSQGANGRVGIGLGLKGMVVLELTVSGSRWGQGPKATIHSSAASLVDSPPFRLAQALATLTDADGRGCKVKGLEEVMSYRKPLGPEERELLETLAQTFSGKDWRDVLPLGGAANIDELNGGSEGMDPLVNFLYGPTFNIAGLRSGFLGPQTSTIPYIVPHEATASLDIRMVVELTPEEIIANVRRHLDAHGFEDVDIEIFSATSHHQTPVDHPYVQGVRQTLSEWQVETTIWPIEAGGGPWTVVPNAFGVPCLRGGVVGGGSRAGEEYIVIEGDGKVAGLAEVEKCHVDLLYAFARRAEALAETS
ncbi:MAG: M20/M25/M40 family metallo-hydrolase [Trueperaceae bacterium]|nr:MAG: M20/M25/M40 family metallo-hydrolase [Trueperaceae bacterium]